MHTLQGKVILITGAGRGWGRELALSLATQGAQLALNDISPLNVEEVAHQINTSGPGHARVYLHDIAKKVAVQALINQVTDDLGRIDILINNANVAPSATLLEMDEWDLHRVFEVNAIGTFLVMQSAARVMREQGTGLIFNLLGDFERDQAAAFVASRLAVAGLTARAARDLAPAHLRVYGLACHLPELSAPTPTFGSLPEAITSLSADPGIPSGSILSIC